MSPISYVFEFATLFAVVSCTNFLTSINNVITATKFVTRGRGTSYFHLIANDDASKREIEPVEGAREVERAK